MSRQKKTIWRGNRKGNETAVASVTGINRHSIDNCWLITQKRRLQCFRFRRVNRDWRLLSSPSIISALPNLRKG